MKKLFTAFAIAIALSLQSIAQVTTEVENGTNNMFTGQSVGSPCMMFTDDFSGPPIGTEWTLINGSWAILDTTMKEYSNYFPSPVNHACYAIVGDTTWENYTISTDMMTTDNDRIGLALNFQDMNNNYLFYWYGELGGSRGIFKYENNVETILAHETSIPIVAGQWYHVEFGSYNGNIILTVDGVEVFNVNTVFWFELSVMYHETFVWGSYYTHRDPLVIEVNIVDNAMAFSFPEIQG